MKTFIIAFLFACCLIVQKLSGGNLTASSTVTVVGSNAPQGTGTSTLSPLQTTLTSTCNTTQLLYGIGANQVNLIVSQDRTLAASGSEILDLLGTVTPLKDIFGSACLFVHIKYILIYILPGTGDINGLTIGNAGSDPWVAGGALGGTTPTQTIYPGGTPFQLGEPTVGFLVSSGSGQLKVLNVSSAVITNYRIVIGGTTV